MFAENCLCRIHNRICNIFLCYSYVTVYGCSPQERNIKRFCVSEHPYYFIGINNMDYGTKPIQDTVAAFKSAKIHA